MMRLFYVAGAALIVELRHNWPMTRRYTAGRTPGKSGYADPAGLGSDVTEEPEGLSEG